MMIQIRMAKTTRTTRTISEMARTHHGTMVIRDGVSESVVGFTAGQRMEIYLLDHDRRCYYHYYYFLLNSTTFFFFNPKKKRITILLPVR
mmetsp:Transcript_20974/g.58295  ORF Transcript_20974/g.58295 Transcript_20974/m.58295 type:complete len:90 (-) Transcript_20974:813-1082(-)